MQFKYVLARIVKQVPLKTKLVAVHIQRQDINKKASACCELADALSF
jgi:hypothetical protein